MIYALDTNVVIDLINGRRPAVREHFRRAVSQGAAVRMCSVVLFELWYGVTRALHRAQNAERLRVFLSGEITVAPFEEEDAIVAGALRSSLARLGTPIGPYDILIAAQALRTGCTLVTGNVAEFVRVEGLDLEDWTTPA